MFRSLLLISFFGLSVLLISLSSAQVDIVEYGSQTGSSDCFAVSRVYDQNPCRDKWPTMTHEQIQESLQLFRAFENSDLVEAVFEAASLDSARPKKETRLGHSLQSLNLSEEDFIKEMQVRLKNLDEYKKFLAQFEPEVAEKMDWVKKGKYRVSVAFKNYDGFPKKYSEVESGKYSQNNVEANAVEWDKTILEHYLGKNYEQHEPKLGAIHEIVIVQLLVENSAELEQILLKQPVYSVTHIATHQDELDENAHLPVRIKK